MDDAEKRERRRASASKAGKIAHAKGVAHEWTSEEARAAGQKGAQAKKEKRVQKTELEGEQV